MPVNSVQSQESNDEEEQGGGDSAGDAAGHQYIEGGEVFAETTNCVSMQLNIAGFGDTINALTHCVYTATLEAGTQARREGQRQQSLRLCGS